jgi:hypothetical protein
VIVAKQLISQAFLTGISNAENRECKASDIQAGCFRGSGRLTISHGSDHGVLHSTGEKKHF